VLDKIRLNTLGLLPAEYQANLGDAKPFFLDGRCCRFLGISYASLRDRVLAGGCDEEILAWAFSTGTARSDEECIIWNHFITKLGWRDERSDVLRQRVAEAGIRGEAPQTVAELLDFDEDRALGGTRSWEAQPITTVIVMGVAGCGKSTVASALAAATGWEFIEADALHSPGNIAKMASGVPLDDADRAPWLEAVHGAAEAVAGRGSRSVVACSALKASYRRILAPDPSHVRFVHLEGGADLMAARLRERKGHYMAETMLPSQFATLERPADALALDASLPKDVLVKRIQQVLNIP
jgi:gluconokinase